MSIAPVNQSSDCVGFPMMEIASCLHGSLFLPWDEEMTRWFFQKFWYRPQMTASELIP
jgi:hypothetical protein